MQELEWLSIDEVHLDDMEVIPRVRSITGTPILTDRGAYLARVIYTLVHPSIVFITTFERLMVIRSGLRDNMV